MKYKNQYCIHFVIIFVRTSFQLFRKKYDFEIGEKTFSHLLCLIPSVIPSDFHDDKSLSLGSVLYWEILSILRKRCLSTRESLDKKKWETLKLKFESTEKRKVFRAHARKVLPFLERLVRKCIVQHVRFLDNQVCNVMTAILQRYLKIANSVAAI